MKAFFEKYREIIVYIIVGVINTIACWIFAWVLTLFMDANIVAINFLMQTLNWLFGVSFSFPMNRKWVFRSTNPHWVQEYIKFAGSRIITWLLDLAIMIFFVNICPLTRFSTWMSDTLLKYGVKLSANDANYWFAKIFISSVLVMIGNYIFSKLIVFRKKNKGTDSTETEVKDE